MPNTTLKTRIQSKYDTYANWLASNPVLLKGEIAIVELPSGADKPSGVQAEPPVILVKVGNGTSTFSALPFINAMAADVYSWAKAATKPTYSADEITGLEEFIEGVSDIDTNTQYSFALEDNYKVVIKKKDLTDADFVEYKTVDLTAAFNAKADKVSGATAGNFAGLDADGNLTDSGKKAADFATAAQGALADSALQKADITTGGANGTIAVEGTDVAVKGLGSAAYTNVEAYAVAGHDHDTAYAAKGTTEAHITNADIHVTTADKTAWNGAVTKSNANETAITTMKAGATVVTFKGVEDAVADAKKAGTDAQADVNALEAKVGTVADGKTVVEMIAEAQAAATYDDTALKGRVTTAEGKITTLIGNDADKSVRTIANEELAAQLIPDNAQESLDTLKEIAAWIQAHPGEAATMNAAIGKLEAIVAGIGGDGEKATVVAYVTDAIAALKIGDYAKAADLTALAGRVTTLEADTHTHDNKAVIDGITAAKVTAWDAAEQNAKTYADGLKTAIDTEVAKKANDADLAAIAKTGNVKDLIQTAGDYVIFDCGSASTNI